MIVISVICMFVLVEKKSDGNHKWAEDLQVSLDTTITSSHYRAALQDEVSSHGQGIAMEVAVSDVGLLEWGKRSSHLSCTANPLFLIQFRAVAAIETAHSGTSFLRDHPGHITDSSFLWFHSVNRSPRHVSPFSSCEP